jgi:hypothetical protein
VEVRLRRWSAELSCNRCCWSTGELSQTANWTRKSWRVLPKIKFVIADAEHQWRFPPRTDLVVNEVLPRGPLVIGDCESSDARAAEDTFVEVIHGTQVAEMPVKLSSFLVASMSGMTTSPQLRESPETANLSWAVALRESKRKTRVRIMSSGSVA